MLDTEDLKEEIKERKMFNEEGGKRYDSDFELNLRVDVIQKLEAVKLMIAVNGIDFKPKRSVGRLEEIIEEINIISGK